MDMQQAGVILFARRFEACIAFYRDRLQLPELFRKTGLVCLRMGAGYLMLEQDAAAANETGGAKSRAQNPTILRFNVPDVAGSAAWLEERGISVVVQHWEWGTIGVFMDPDGNRCELKNHEPAFD